MGTLYLLHIPDDVLARLEQLAEQAGTSVNVLAVRELERACRGADNLVLLSSLPDLGIDRGEIVSDLRAARAGR